MSSTPAIVARKKEKRETFKAALLSGSTITEAAKIAGCSGLEARLWRGAADLAKVLPYRVTAIGKVNE